MAKVKSAERTFRLLELAAKRRNGLTFTEIQSELDIPKSSTHSLIQEFLDSGYLLYDTETKKYHAGMEYIKLCTSCIRNTDLLSELSLLTTELGKELNCTTHAGLLDHLNIMYLARYESDKKISLMHAPGQLLPAHCTAMGKILLSQFDNATIQQMYSSYTFVKLTENSIHTITDLIKNLDLIRKQGYAVEIREASNYSACIALPIEKNQQAIAAFSITMPILTFETAELSVIIETMQKHKKMAEQRIFAY